MARSAATAAVASFVACLLLAASAAAKVFIVTSAADADAAGAVNDGICTTASDGCTLRAAIREANGTSGPDEVALPARNYVLTIPTELGVSSTVTIDGEGARTTTIDAGGDSRVFNVTGGSVVMNALSITGGVGSDAGGIAVSGTTELILDRVAVHGNTATGAGNQRAGAIDLFQGGLIVRRSALYDNEATASSTNQAAGGAVSIAAGADSATFETVTVANNRATSQNGSTFGGGISATGAPVTLRHVTMTGNAASTGGNGGNLYANDLGDIVLENSIVAGGSAQSGPNCRGSAGTPVSHGVNLSDDASCGLPAGNPIAPAKLEP